MLDRKKNIEHRLSQHGIKDYKITHLPYLEFDPSSFATSKEAGARMIILLSVSYISQNLNKRDALKDWLKREGIWEHVSKHERGLFNGDIRDEESLIDFSWEGESAYILGWALNLIDKAPSPEHPITDAQFEHFAEMIPALGGPLSEFLTRLKFRNTIEIFDENIFYELATAYFRDLMLSGRKDESNVDSHIAYLRHKTLNWLRRYEGIKEWDETDTST